MDGTKCEALLAAVEGGSLTSAAEKLGYTQPGITRMIDALEREMGFPLLVRTKRGVELTPNGRTALPALREVARACRVATETAADIHGVIEGYLTIGCYYSVSSMLLPQTLKRFLGDYPGVRIALKEGTNAEIAEWLAERSIDLAYSAKPSPQVPCDWIPVLDDELTVWLPENHELANRKRFPVDRLANYPFIITQPGKDTDIDRLLANASVSVDVRFATKDAYSTYRMVEAGLGISLNQRLIARDWHGDVIALPFDPPQRIELGIAIPSLADASPAAKRFLEYVRFA